VVSAGTVEPQGVADGASPQFLQVADEDVVSSEWSDHEEATALKCKQSSRNRGSTLDVGIIGKPPSRL
jgi:hypothetical protein